MQNQGLQNRMSRLFSYLIVWAIASVCCAQTRPVDGDRMVAATTQPNAESALEAPEDKVVDSFREVAPEIGLSATDTEALSAWLKRILFRAHRSVDAASISEFADALKAFPKNSGVNFQKDHDAGIAELKFCCDIGWRLPQTTLDQKTVLRQYYDLAHKVLDQITTEINDSVPVEKRDKWTRRINQTTGDIAYKLDGDIDQWNNDFLFPAFKEPLTAAAQKSIEQLTDGDNGILNVPRYGVIVQLMQTRDEAFQVQLEQMSKYFDRVFCRMLSFHQIVGQVMHNKYWSHCDISSQGTDSGWPIRFRLTPRVGEAITEKSRLCEGYSSSQS